MTKREEYLKLETQPLSEKYFFTKKEDKIEPIGQGGSGIVYEVKQIFGKDKNIYTKRAIKFFVFRDDLMDSWGIVSVSNFQTEIKNITRFNHQNILKVIDGDFLEIDIEGTQHFIPYTITELIEGYNLEDLFEDENIEKCKKIFCKEEIVFDIFHQIVSGIEYLHHNDFFHCDIAPKNIFLKTDKDNKIFAVLGDLGAGCSSDKLGKDKVRVIGTYAFMPEEVKVLKNKEISYEEFAKLQPHWDLYSTVHSLKMIISDIINNKIISDTWYLKRLYEKLECARYSSIVEIKEDIEHLKPSTTQVFKLDELSEASPNVKPHLLPCNPVMLSKRMKKLAKHDMMLRLMDVPQLLEGATTFTGANHTRYEHSLGTYELMRRAMIELLRNENFTTKLKEKDVILGLLGALLSSLTNFPYSYAIQELQVQNPELFPELSNRKLFIKLMEEKSEVTNKSIIECIERMFPGYDINSEEIAYVIFGKGEFRDSDLDKLHLLLNSSIGVRIIDYLLRDAHHIGISCRIETDNLFKNLYIRNNEFCLSQGGVASAEQIITNRSWMFKRIYWSDPNRANAALLKYLFYTVYCDNNKVSYAISNCVSNAIKKSIQDLLLQYSSEEKRPVIQQGLNFINHKGQTRYKSVLVLDRSSLYECANQSCQTFSKMNYKEQCEVRKYLENEFMKKYNVSEDELNKGIIILIDMPAESMNNKLGGDIRIRRHDDSMLMLDKFSGLVKGIKENYDEQLKLLRVYIRPDIYDKYINDEREKKEEMACFFNELLCKKL